jgi:hypothetical protein
LGVSLLLLRGLAKRPLCILEVGHIVDRVVYSSFIEKDDMRENSSVCVVRYMCRANPRRGQLLVTCVAHFPCPATVEAYFVRSSHRESALLHVLAERTEEKCS